MGMIEKNQGFFQEYDIARENNNYIIPVSSTGFAAQSIYDEMEKANELPDDFGFLKKEENIEDIVDGIIHKLKIFKKEKEKKLNERLFSSISMYGIGVFLSYHYDSDNKIARQITEIINTDTINIFTVIREDEKEKDDEIVKNWVDEKIKGTRITILLISKETLDRKYVSYELEKSLSQRNSIIPILIDSEENAFDDEKIDLIIQKLDTELLGMKLKLRKWYQENGKENILRWLNEELEEK